MSGGGGGAVGRETVAEIPEEARPTVQGVKDIVNCPEAEIYAVLRECNMDTSEAVNRLLFKDTFHEVKSKHKKKEKTKGTPESQSRAINDVSNHEVRSGLGRGDNNNTLQFCCNDDGATSGKPIIGKDDYANMFPALPSLGSRVPANNTNRWPPVLNDSASRENTTQRTAGHNVVCSLSRPSAISQHSLFGGPGLVTMADIVKRGRHQGKVSIAPNAASDTSYTSHSAVMSNVSAKGSPITSPTSESNLDLQSSQALVSKYPEKKHVTGSPADRHLSLIKQPSSGSASAVLVAPAVYDSPSMSSTLLVGGVDVFENRHVHGIRVPEGNANDEEVKMDNYGDISGLVDGSLVGRDSFQLRRHVFEPYEVEDGNVEISSAVASMQQLSLPEDLYDPFVGHRPTLIVPDHLQVTDVDCSYLSFGSYGSGVNTTVSGSFPSRHLKSNLEVAPISDNAVAVDQLKTRESKYYDNRHLRPTSDVNVDSRTGKGSRNYATPPASQPAIIRNGTLDATHRFEYNIPPVSVYSLPTTTRDNVATYIYPQKDSQMKKLPLSSLMTRKLRVFPSEPNQQRLPSTSIPTGPTLPQHLPVQQFSQPTFPSTHFANMIGYPSLPHIYTNTPSATFQPIYTGNGAMHQSAGASQCASLKNNLPQYRSSVSVSNLTQSGVVPPGYGGFQSSIPGAYTINPTPSSSSRIGEILSSQYKEGDPYIVQQGENPAMWAQASGSRMMSPLPATSTLYNTWGQSQHSRFQQGQQPSPLTNLGYANLYHSQQNPSEGNPNSYQGAWSQHSNQMWRYRD